MDLYKCDTFNLVLSDLPLTQTDSRSCETESVRTYRVPLLMQVALVDRGHGLPNTSLAALFKGNHLCRIVSSASRGSRHHTGPIGAGIKIENR